MPVELAGVRVGARGRPVGEDVARPDSGVLGQLRVAGLLLLLDAGGALAFCVVLALGRS